MAGLFAFSVDFFTVFVVYLGRLSPIQKEAKMDYIKRLIKSPEFRAVLASFLYHFFAIEITSTLDSITVESIGTGYIFFHVAGQSVGHVLNEFREWLNQRGDK